MTRIRTFACIALLASLVACQDKTPTASTASNAPAKPAEPGGLTGMVGAAMDKARAEMETKNIDISNVAIKFGDSGRVTPRQPKAEITPQGDLLIEGKPVAVTPAQRQLLLQYRGEIIGVASAGMEIGKQGVDMAGKAVSTAITSIFSGKDKGQVEQDMEAQGERIEAAAMKLCDQLQPMLDTQQKLVVELPAFKPYANLTQADIDDCRERDAHRADRTRVKDEIRQDIRQGIRDSIRGTVQSATRGKDFAESEAKADAAAEADAAAVETDKH